MPQPSLLGFLQDKDSQRAVGRGLLDAANRGWIAQTFGAPVDMATQAVNLGIAGAGYLGHKAGLFKQPPDLLDSARVPGSSEWIGQKMQNAGMVSPNRNPIAEAGMGLLSPVAFKGAQKVGGLLANAEMKAADNLAQPSTMRMAGQRGAILVDDDGAPKTYYHGTSKNFDKFMKKYGGSVWDDRASKNAFFFTANRDEADHFAQIAASRVGGDPRRVEANIDLNKYERITPDRLSRYTDDWLRTLKPNEREMQMATKEYESPDGGISRPLEYAILQAKKLGRDGVTVELDDGTDWAVVFNQKSILRK